MQTGVEALARPIERSIDGWHSQPARADWLDACLPDFSASRGKSLAIRWTHVPDPSRLVQTLLVVVNSGAATPELVDVDPAWAGRLTRLVPSPLVSLEGYLRGGTRDFVQEAFSDPWTVGGHVVALGSELNVALLGYRTDVWSSAAIQAPLFTWDDVIEAGRRVVTRAPEGLFFVRADGAGTAAVMSAQGGGGFVGPSGRLQLDHPANVRALDFLSRLVNREHVASVLPYDRPGGNRPGGDTLGYAAAAAFKNGTVAGEIGPMARLSGEMRTDAPETAGKWRVQALPRWRESGGRPISVIVPGSGLGVMRASTQSEVAADFTSWVHLGQSAMLDFERRQTWPVNRRLYEDPRLDDPVPWFHGQSIGPILRQAAANAVACVLGPYWPEVARVLVPAIRAIVNGQAEARSTLAEAQVAARTIVAQSGGSPD
jgi:ABC-type glycerol-3-phosphate transport system substrate-binding protein